jgi:hypothetical protein
MDTLAMQKVSPEQLLAELEDLLRTMPPRATIRHETNENLAWFGRAAALIENWDNSKMPAFHLFYGDVVGLQAHRAAEGLKKIITMLHQMRQDLKFRLPNSANIAIPEGMVFDYFDEVRKVIELAESEIFFIDPYLDASFVSRYLAHVRKGVVVKLLTSDKRLNSLLPAVDMFVQQSGLLIFVRMTNDIHDRFILVDEAACYQSGASFKDGAKTAPTTLTQIFDLLPAMKEIYGTKWHGAKIER